MLVDTPLLDLRREHRTESVPPETHSFVADIDATLKQQIFNLPQRERIPDDIMTVRRITSGELLKYRKGFCIPRGYGTLIPASSRFSLMVWTPPITASCAPQWSLVLTPDRGSVHDGNYDDWV